MAGGRYVSVNYNEHEDPAPENIKIWLESSDKEQKRRFEARIDDPLRQWKLSPIDLPLRKRWFRLLARLHMMLKATDTKHAPWYILRSDDKKRAAELSRPHSQADPAQEAAAGEGEAARALDETRPR